MLRHLAGVLRPQQMLLLMAQQAALPAPGRRSGVPAGLLGHLADSEAAALAQCRAFLALF